MAEVHSEDGNLEREESQTAQQNSGSQSQANGNGADGSWLIQIKQEFIHQQKRDRSFGDVCIYRVPKFMKASMEEAYVPQVVAFGPYNRTLNPQLSAMDRHKLDAVRRTLSWMNGVSINDLIETIKDLEIKIRDSYEESIEWEGETLAWMFTMDACFILDFFRAICNPQMCQQREPDNGSLVIYEKRDPDAVLREYIDRHTDPILGQYVNLLMGPITQYNLLNRRILTDIMKLENQIPLFIFITIFELKYRNTEKAVSGLSKMLSILRFLPPFPTYNYSSQLQKNIFEDADHLLDVFRRIKQTFFTDSSLKSPTTGNVGYLTPLPCICNMTSLPKLLARMRASSKPLMQNPIYEMSIPSAESLQNVGIKFKPDMDGKVRFERHRGLRGSTLFLPPFFAVDSSEIYLRNLLAFEERRNCFSPSDRVISSVMMLMDFLINSEKDVAILRKAGIVHLGAAGDIEVAAMFNNVGKGVSFPPVREFFVIANQLRDHYNSGSKRWFTKVKEEWGSKPWYIVSVLVATSLLVMTAMQTYYASVQTKYSVKSYHDGHN